MTKSEVEDRRTSEWVLWDAPEPLARAHDAMRFCAAQPSWAAFPLDHVGWFESRGDVERIVRELALPHESFRSVVLGREVGRALTITRVALSGGVHLELFSPDDEVPPAPSLLARAHLAFRAPDSETFGLVAERFRVPVREALGGARLAYLRPHLELLWTST